MRPPIRQAIPATTATDGRTWKGFIVTAGPTTVLKALALLDFFTDRRPKIGLSEFAKLSGYDKATALRFLNSLESKGFVEQDEETRMYNLGPAFLRFAQLREASFPLTEAVGIVLRDLNAATDETAHASTIAGEWLANIGTVESKRANRVIVEPGEALPFHATASGQVYLAFASEDVAAAALKKELLSHTADTITDPNKIEELLRQIRETGIAHSEGTYEDGVLGIAAPYFGPNGTVSGAVAVALPIARATKSHVEMIEIQVRDSAKRLTALRGGYYPEAFPK
ncbi:IclR family transcriptional regulator [Thioclava sp. FR2]|uniref:IclR family transcriptional regulator n=1 Tax=Thioclava sp. FR2 TaxID=3445780 RepID=UPI003EB8BDA4